MMLIKTLAIARLGNYVQIITDCILNEQPLD